MAQPTAQMESPYKAVQPSGAAISGSRAQTTSTKGIGPAGFCHTLLEYDAVLATWPSVMKTCPEFLDSVGEARWKDTAWCMLRCRHDDDDDAPQKVPGWSGFNAAVGRAAPPKHPVW